MERRAKGRVWVGRKADQKAAVVAEEASLADDVGWNLRLRYAACQSAIPLTYHWQLDYEMFHQSRVDGT